MLGPTVLGEVEDMIADERAQGQVGVHANHLASSVRVHATISPVGATMTELSIMWWPSSEPHLAAAATQIPFREAVACREMMWVLVRRCTGSFQWMLVEGVLQPSTTTSAR